MLRCRDRYRARPDLSWWWWWQQPDDGTTGKQHAARDECWSTNDDRKLTAKWRVPKPKVRTVWWNRMDWVHELCCKFIAPIPSPSYVCACMMYLLGGSFLR